MQIHHSRDLVNWRLLTRPLRRASQLNLLGDPDSCGVWAPDLTYADGHFYLVYPDVKRYGRTTVAGAAGASLRDFHNYLVTSPDIDGDWSDPVSPSWPQSLRRHRLPGVLGRGEAAGRAARVIFCYSALTRVDFEPQHFQQAAGLICDYNSSKFHYLYISKDEASGKHVRVMSAVPDQAETDAFTPAFAIPPNGAVELRVEIDCERLHFGYRVSGAAWTWIPQQFDASILSDEATTPGLPNFTGAFVGVACQDMSGARCPADFDWFEYLERPYRTDPFGRDQ